MFIDSKYNDYNKIVEIHDNYLILTNKNHIFGESGDPDTIPAVINYFDPAITIPISYASSSTLTFTNQIDLTNNLEDRFDFPKIFICGFIIIYVLVFIINNLTRLFKKGRYFVN